MDEYIEREAAVNAIIAIMPSMSTPDGHGERDDLVLAAQEMCEDNIREINNIPAADVAPVAHGRWEWITEDRYRCNNCGRITRVDECMGKPMYSGCPYCRAKMDLTEDCL